MLEINFIPFPELSTQNLTLTMLTESDAADYHEMRADAETMQYIPRPKSTSVNDTIALIKTAEQLLADGMYITWGIKLKGANKLIGTIGYYRIKKEDYRGEIGYMLNKHFCKKGIMTEAIKCIIDYGFSTIKFHSIEAVIDPANAASEKILLRHNFVKEAHIKENVFWQGKFLDSVIYSLINKK